MLGEAHKQILYFHLLLQEENIVIVKILIFDRFTDFTKGLTLCVRFDQIFSCMITLGHIQFLEFVYVIGFSNAKCSAVENFAKFGLSKRHYTLR